MSSSSSRGTHHEWRLRHLIARCLTVLHRHGYYDLERWHIKRLSLRLLECLPRDLDELLMSYGGWLRRATREDNDDDNDDDEEAAMRGEPWRHIARASDHLADVARELRAVGRRAEGDEAEALAYELDIRANQLYDQRFPELGRLLGR